ncbi:MAG: RagB/SusD family nutrient uptake outer membrane protein [Wenyingzhuangia sp.]|uniref:RagB/SusD family nutrient uptake outer membrane protein n=1 Tax=Wenyingzhuangia sp. TaxID=1964193 RepID=UPI003219F24A
MTCIRNDYRHGAGNGGWAQIVPEIKVYNTWPAGGYRRAVSFTEETVFLGDHDSDASTPDEAYEVHYTQFGIADGSVHGQALARPFIAKYYRFPGSFARGSVRATSHNPSMMRYAEVLLIAAEAAVELQNNAAATNYINQVRARARSGGSWKSTPASAVPADISGTVTVNDVLEERRFELAFECKRWYDIVRRRLGPDAFGPNGLEVRPGFTDSDYLTPIPATEVRSNPNL